MINTSEVMRITELAAYTPDAIVSRTLVKNTAGNVTLFAFGAGQGLSKHSAPFDALVQVIDGKLFVTIDQQDHALCAGEMILMPANIPHAVHAPEDARMLLVMLKDKSDNA
jgi:quercetin dioxygenase-like cupin family protein